MPITLSSLKRQTAPISISCGDLGDLVLQYLPHKISPGYLESMKEDADLMALARVVNEIVDSWDLVEDDSTVIPVTVETAANLGVSFLQDIIREVASDSRPLARKKNGKS